MCLQNHQVIGSKARQAEVTIKEQRARSTKQLHLHQVSLSADAAEDTAEKCASFPRKRNKRGGHDEEQSPKRLVVNHLTPERNSGQG